MRGIVEVLSGEIANSAYHGTRLDVNHISEVMNKLVTAAERRFGLNRYSMAEQLVFVSHETFTPARGGSASAEVLALRNNFGEAAKQIVVANTKGFTGHAMGAGVEDVIAVKILEYGIVPPVPNYKEVDPDLGVLKDKLSADQAWEVYEAAGKRDITANRVVDVYLADVEIGRDGAPMPLHYRERMRVKGPSVRLDLGKQAAGGGGAR